MLPFAASQRAFLPGTVLPRITGPLPDVSVLVTERPAFPITLVPLTVPCLPWDAPAPSLW